MTAAGVANSKNGGTGGGGCDGASSGTSARGTGDKKSKYPFLDTVNFQCHCAGGGGGALATYSRKYRGGAGGTNGGNGSNYTSSSTSSVSGGNGGTYGAGRGGSADAVVVSHTHTQNAHNHAQNGHIHGTSSSENNKFLIYSGTNIAINSTGRRWTSGDGSVFYVYEQSGDGGIGESTKTGSTAATNQSATATNQSTGVSGTGKNMPPYLAVYVWKRTG